jgi:hypothetical protein
MCLGGRHGYVCKTSNFYQSFHNFCGLIFIIVNPNDVKKMHKNNEFVQTTLKQNAFCESAVSQHHVSEDLNPQNLFKFWPS